MLTVLALAAALAAIPDPPGVALDPDDAGALLEAVLRGDVRLRAAPPCEERTRWVGDPADADVRDLGPCADDAEPWLRAPRPTAGDEDGGEDDD